MQLPSLEDIVNGLVNFVGNAVSTVVKWLGDAVGWLWSTIHNYIVKPISDFISWLFETAKSVLVRPVLGFVSAALGALQRKAFGTLYIAITYKLMLAEAKRIMEASSAREAVREFLWLMVKPIIVYLALSSVEAARGSGASGGVHGAAVDASHTITTISAYGTTCSCAWRAGAVDARALRQARSGGHRRGRGGHRAGG